MSAIELPAFGDEYGQPFNGRRAIVIGHVTLLKPLDEHYAGYETASWWTDSHAEPQTVPVVYRDKWASFSLRSVVTDDYFVNRVFTASSSKRGEGIGKPFHISRQADLWGMSPDTWNDGETFSVEWAPFVTFRQAAWHEPTSYRPKRAPLWAAAIDWKLRDFYLEQRAKAAEAE